MTDQHFDTLIIGAGSMGMAAGYFLSRAGQRVLMLDAGDPPHDQGSHHGGTRLIRHAYGEGAGYVPLALRAQALWAELERASGETVFARTGVVNIGPADDPFLKEVQRGAQEHGLPLEVLSAEEAGRRWPAWRLPAEDIACFEPDAGVLFCERAVLAYRRLALAQGAQLLTDTPVSAVRVEADGVSVVTERGACFRGRHAIVCAGRHTQRLLAQCGLTLPLTRLRKTFAWFDADAAGFGPAAFPGFSISTPQGQFYGFPDVDGSGFKVGRHDGGQVLDADAALAPFGDEAADLADLEGFVRRYLPGVGALRVGKTCQYIMTPDEHFIIDALPGHPHVQLATGFSGHGFKFASALGEALSQRVLEGRSQADLSLFALARFDPA